MAAWRIYDPAHFSPCELDYYYHDYSYLGWDHNPGVPLLRFTHIPTVARYNSSMLFSLSLYRLDAVRLLIVRSGSKGCVFLSFNPRH